MLIAIECRGCGKKYATEAKYAGRTIHCKACRAPIVVPAAGASSPAPTPTVGHAGSEVAPVSMIRFACEACGKSYSTPSRLAGRKSVCKACGRAFHIPGGTGAAADRPATAHKGAGRRPPALDPTGLDASRPPRPDSGMPLAPDPVDIYGLAEEPTPAPVGASASFSPSVPFADVASSSEPEVLPARLGDMTPMDDGQKQKIARRAERVDRSRPYRSNSALGVSFGTVLVIALFGWRMHRALTRFQPAAERFEAAAAAPEDSPFLDGSTDPKSSTEDTDRHVERLIASPSSGEAREWLDVAKHPNHAIFELGNDKARILVEGFYERGAERVYVLDAEPIANQIVSAMLGVKLPGDPARRKRCLEWEARNSEGEPTSPDMGQRYLMITTD